IIAELRLQGWGCQNIALELNRRGYRHPHSSRGRAMLKFDSVNPNTLPGRTFVDSSIRQIVSNRFYVEFKPGCGHGTAMTADGELIEGRHIAAWTIETWERMQEIKEQLRYSPKAQPYYRHAYPFAGTIVCPLCGTAMRAHHDIGSGRRREKMYEYRYYRCTGSNRVLCPSKRKYTQCQRVEDAFGTILMSLIRRTDWQKSLVSFLDAQQDLSSEDEIEK